MLYNVTPNFSLSAPPRSTGRVALPQRPSVGDGLGDRVLDPAAAGSVAKPGRSVSLVSAAAPRPQNYRSGGSAVPTTDPNSRQREVALGGFDPANSNKVPNQSSEPYNPKNDPKPPSHPWITEAVDAGLQAGRYDQIANGIAPQIANTMAKSETDPLINELNLQIGLNGSQYANQLVGFDAQRQKATDDYNNAVEALKISERGRTDKRWLMDEMLKLQMAYYDRINASLVDQAAAAQRQNPLLAAEKADNSRLYELKAGELGRAKESATDDNAMKQWEMDQNAATGAGWQTKGYKIRSKTQTKEYERTMANIESDLETARINRDANDRNLTEKEAQVKDQLAQLWRDGAANTDKRVGDYLQYLFDVSELGRGAAEDALRARQAQQTRDYQRTMIDSNQQQALVDRQRSDSQLRMQQQEALNNSHQNALVYLGQVKQSLAATGQDQQAQRFFDWFMAESTRKGATQEQALSYLASYVGAGNPLVIPSYQPVANPGISTRDRGSGTWTK